MSKYFEKVFSSDPVFDRSGKKTGKTVFNLNSGYAACIIEKIGEEAVKAVYDAVSPEDLTDPRGADRVAMAAAGRALKAMTTASLFLRDMDHQIISAAGEDHKECLSKYRAAAKRQRNTARQADRYKSDPQWRKSRCESTAKSTAKQKTGTTASKKSAKGVDKETKLK